MKSNSNSNSKNKMILFSALKRSTRREELKVVFPALGRHCEPWMKKLALK
jgi:hypothetical protein